MTVNFCQSADVLNESKVISKSDRKTTVSSEALYAGSEKASQVSIHGIVVIFTVANVLEGD